MRTTPLPERVTRAGNRKVGPDGWTRWRPDLPRVVHDQRLDHPQPGTGRDIVVVASGRRWPDPRDLANRMASVRTTLAIVTRSKWAIGWRSDRHSRASPSR